MSSSEGLIADPTQWMTIPKGLDRSTGVMTVTVQWVPPSGFPIRHCGWPRIASAATLSFTLCEYDKASAGAGPWHYLRTLWPWADGVDEGMWDAVFTPPSVGSMVDRSKIVTRKTAAKQKPLVAWETAKLSVYLSQIAAALSDGHRSRGQRPGDHEAYLKPRLTAMMPVVWTRALMSNAPARDARASTAREPRTRSNHETLCGALATVLALYLPSAPSAAEVAAYITKGEEDGVLELGNDVSSILSQLSSAYGDAGEAQQTQSTTTEPTWQAQLARKAPAGLKHEQLCRVARNVVSRMNRSKATRSADPHEAIFYEAVAGMAPWKREYGNRFRDDEVPDPLAGIGQSFTLQTQLGMIRDIKLDLKDWPPGAQRALLSGQPLKICAVPSFPADPPSGADTRRTWTAMGSDRFPLDLSQPHAGSENRLLSLEGAHLTTLELRQSLQRFVSTSQTVRGKLDFQSQAPDKAANDAPFAPGFKSGPLSLMLHGAALNVVDRVAKSRAKTLSSADDATIGLQEMTIGVRPDLQIFYPGGRGRSPWRPLLGRRLRYTFGGATLPSTPGDESAGRMEGYIPLTRMSSSLHDALTVEDELFAWHGWNPAVPVPGRQAKQGGGGNRPLPVAEPVPGSNPAFRYGSRVWARARIVLRDGSSLPVPSGAPAHGPDCVIGCDALGKAGDGCGIVRYEPLKAPAVLLGEPLESSAWLPPESLDHVVLGTSRHRASLSRERSVRYWLPGAIRDISEVERHGAFDTGRTPNATAFPYQARGGEDFETVQAPDLPYPAPAPDTAPDPGQTPPPRSRLPIFRLGKPPYLVKLPYYPDPLVRGLVLALARKSKTGQWLPVQENGQSMCWVHPFYSVRRVWPDAIALRIEISGHYSDIGRSCHYAPPELPTGEARLSVHVPPGEQVSLVAWPYGDPARLQDAHAFGCLAAHWDRFVAAEGHPGVPLEFPSQGVSGLIAETVSLLIDHFVDVPDAPAVTHAPPDVARKRPPLSAQQPFDLSAWAAPGSTGGIDVVARWTDPLDEPGTAGPTYPRPIDTVEDGAVDVQQAPVCVMTPGLLIAADSALSDPMANTMRRPPIAVPADGMQRGSYALPDSRHRYVRYVPIARSRLPKPGGGPLQEDGMRAREGAGVTFNVLASARPLVPVVRDVLPAFAFERSQRSNEARSHRITAVTLMLERGWWSSGPGELLAIKVTGASVKATNPVDSPQHASAWGGDPALSIDGKIRRPLKATDFGPTEQSVAPGDAPQAIDGKPPADVVLFRPDFDSREKCWRVDVMLHTPPSAAQPFLQLALARYQPDAIRDMNFSPVVLADFIQLQDNRYATIVPNPLDATKFQVTVRGPLVDGHLERRCVEKGACAAKEGCAGNNCSSGMACCIERRRCIEAWLELAPRWNGTSPLWKQHGPSVFLAAELASDAAIWCGELTVQQRLELPTRRMRVCLMERGLFPGEPVAGDPRNLHDGPPYYLDQLEFTAIDYNGDDHP